MAGNSSSTSSTSSSPPPSPGPSWVDSKCQLFGRAPGSSDRAASSSNDTLFHMENNYGGIPKALIVSVMAFVAITTVFAAVAFWEWRSECKQRRRRGERLRRRRQESDHPEEVEEEVDGGGSGTPDAGGGLMAYLMKRGVKRAEKKQMGRTEQEARERRRSLLQGAGEIGGHTPGQGEYQAIQSTPVQQEAETDSVQALPSRSETPSTPSNADKYPPRLSPADFPSFWRYMAAIFTYPDDAMRRECGPDGLHYLLLQRYCMGLLAIICVVSLVIVLPINFQGDKFLVSEFGRTSLANLDVANPLLWAHVVLSVAVFFLTVATVSRYRRATGMDVEEEMPRTIMISGIPPDQCNRAYLMDFFAKSFGSLEPERHVIDMRFVYDVTSLEAVQEDLVVADRALNFTATYGDTKVYHWPMGWCFSSCGFCPTSSAETYYPTRVTDLNEKRAELVEQSLKRPAGVAFVTFDSKLITKRVYKTFKEVDMGNGWFGTVSFNVKKLFWEEKYAPVPEDIFWGNIRPRGWLAARMTIAYIVIFFIVLFVSTPEVLLEFHFLQDIIQVGGETLVPAAVRQYVPVLVAMSVTVALPVVIAWLDRWLGHWTRTEENTAIMKKSFWYLIFSVVFLPTFGFKSMLTLLMALGHLEGDGEGGASTGADGINWECFFEPNNGAFFINYLLTATFIGAVFELLHLPDIFLFSVYWLFARSPAEVPGIKESLKYEFRFGEQYARVFLIVSITIIYAIVCPLISPFGLLYLVIKHHVDRAGLLFYYKPVPFANNHRIHTTALGLLLAAPIMAQFFLTILLLLQNGASLRQMDTRTIIATLVFIFELTFMTRLVWPGDARSRTPDGDLRRDGEAEERQAREKAPYEPELLRGKCGGDEENVV